jgi:hypothetical protein
MLSGERGEKASSKNRRVNMLQLPLLLIIPYQRVA